MERNTLFKEVYALRQHITPSVNEQFDYEMNSYSIDNQSVERFGINDTTLYLKIDLGVKEKVPKLTGVYLPTDFSKTDSLDVIIYFHGLVKGICKDIPDKFRKSGVAYYWQAPSDSKKQPNFQLREWLHSADKKAILIVPTLGTNSQNDFGGLGNAFFFDQYLNRILKALQSKSLIPTESKWRHIILAGHSGGGKVMNEIIVFDKKASDYVQNIQECWGLDCFYYGAENWKKWIKNKKREQRLFAFHTGQSSSAATAKAIKKYADAYKPIIENVFEKSMGGIKEHCPLVANVWQNLINNSPFLEKY